MSTLSLCMIVKDEELSLPRILNVCFTFADEVIIVDTGSTDRTKDIAVNAGCKVYDFTWIDDFAAARNYAFSLAKCDYLMWLDADDVITCERAEKLAKLKENLTADVVMLPYHMGTPPTLIFWRERILKRNMGFKFVGEVHEAIEVSGNIIYEDIPIVHDKLKPSDPERNLNIFNRILAKKGTLSGREAFYYGSELYYNGMYDKAEKWLKAFLTQSGSYADKGQAALFISRIKKESGEKLDALKTGLTFAFSPDLLCEMGEIYFIGGNYKAAKACFLTAIVADESITFSRPECKSYVPHIRLCACYWNAGDKEKAKYHNDMALKAKPNDRYAKQNSALFK